MTTTLKGMTWAHARGLDPLVAASEKFEARTGIKVEWVARSLSDFELFPMEELAAKYDMIMIDHPHIGISHEESLLQPLDTLLPAEILADQKAGSVGQSYDSYTWEHHQYALPLDAAAQVSAYREELIGGSLPTTWAEVFELAKKNLQKVAIPFVPVHAYSSFYTLCSHFSEGIVWSDGSYLSEEAGVKALDILVDLLAVAHPDSKDMDPINMLDRMCQSDDIIYSPLVYGYSNYAREGYAKYLVKFADMPSAVGEPKGSMIGGVGLAISTKCKNIEAALEFMKFVAPSSAQKGLLFDAGGQPGHREAWQDERVNEISNNFFAGTLKTLDLGSMRPRFAGYVDFQAEAGRMIREFVVNGTGDKAEFVEQLNILIDNARRGRNTL